jgi:hypothetical protein
MHHDGFYLYHLWRVQHLLLGDNTYHVRFCEWPQPWLHILFPDEAQFNWDGITNTRNLHSWAHKNPHEIAECHFQHRFSFNVWCGILGNNLIGPHVIEGCIRAPYQRNFLENELLLHLENVPLAT